MKRALQTLGLLALAAMAYGQTVGNALRIPLISDDDSDSVATFRFCVLLGSGDEPLAQGRMVNIRTTTVGSSTTVTAAVAGTGPFQNVAVGDELTWPTPGTTPAGTATPAGGETVRYVVSKASADSIVVGPAAIDLSIPATGYPFTHRKKACGTTITDGWFSTINFQDFDVTVSVDQGDATSVDAILQCENVGATSMPNNIWVKNYLLATYGNPETGRTTVAVYNHFDRCRVGISLTDDASDAGATAEKISATVRGRRPNP